MIKLIATDLDGTLLDGERKLPAEIFPLIERLYSAGILFAPASGRQYASLQELFRPVEDKVVFVCENGALVKYRGETLFSRPIPPEHLKTALHTVRKIERLYPMFCCGDCAYIENAEQPFYDYANFSYPACEKVDSLDALTQKKDVYKIAVYDGLGAAENCMKLLPDRLPELRVMISGKDWCDVSERNSNKGEAIKFLQKIFSVTREECAAFGDHMNDYEMLLACARAFVPENGFGALKEKFKSTVPANTEGGVLKKIKEILNENGDIS